jgi:AcrR family transcriptional regulator
MAEKHKATRTGQKPPLMRGEPVVRGILDAALEELARTGYGALRVEDVAARAGVNKTTVYRRWPTKEDLVRAAILSMTADTVTAPGTGSLRGDLLEVARRFVSVMGSCGVQGLMRLVLAEGPDSELFAIAKSLKKVHESVPRAVVEAAQARGELLPGIDAVLLFDVLIGAIHKKIHMDREPAPDEYLGRVVDLILHGAQAHEERVRPPARSVASKARSVG